MDIHQITISAPVPGGKEQQKIIKLQMQIPTNSETESILHREQCCLVNTISNSGRGR